MDDDDENLSEDNSSNESDKNSPSKGKAADLKLDIANK
jgi:hypothetical protein